MDDTLVGRAVYLLARSLALLGGIVLILIVGIVTISIIGRAFIPLGLRPIPGDTELVQAGMVLAIFAFLPWCQLSRGHALVAILTDRFPARATAMLEFLMDAVLTLASAYIAWRIYYGMLDKISFREQTFILRLPVWWSYASGFAGAVVMVVVGVYCTVRSAANAFSANPVRPVAGGAE